MISRVAFRLRHPNLFVKLAVEKSRLDIEMTHIKIALSHQAQDKAD